MNNNNYFLLHILMFLLLIYIVLILSNILQSLIIYVSNHLYIINHQSSLKFLVLNQIHVFQINIIHNTIMIHLIFLLQYFYLNRNQLLFKQSLYHHLIIHLLFFMLSKNNLIKISSNMDLRGLDF